MYLEDLEINLDSEVEFPYKVNLTKYWEYSIRVLGGCSGNLNFYNFMTFVCLKDGILEFAQILFFM